MSVVLVLGGRKFLRMLTCIERLELDRRKPLASKHLSKRIKGITK